MTAKECGLNEEIVSDYIRNLKKALIRDYKLTMTEQVIRSTTFFECEIKVIGRVQFIDCDFVNCKLTGEEPIMTDCKVYTEE